MLRFSRGEGERGEKERGELKREGAREGKERGMSVVRSEEAFKNYDWACKNTHGYPRKILESLTSSLRKRSYERMRHKDRYGDKREIQKHDE